MERKEAHTRRRVVLVPCPLQGHITPMLRLGTILHSKGFSVVIAYTRINPPDPSKHPDFDFQPILENISDADATPANLIAMFKNINSNCEAPFKTLLAKMVDQHDNHQVGCIIHDTLTYFAETAAQHMKIPSIILHTTSASSLLAYRAIPPLHAKGYVPLKDSILQDLVPGVHPLRFMDLPISHQMKVEEVLDMIALGSTARASSAIIFNTVEHLEHSTLAKLQQSDKVPFFLLGPLHKMVPTLSTSLLKEDTDCIMWLDRQAPNSVVYVSMGSLATIDEKELTETAWGLANSHQPFLWVIRPGSINDSEWVAPLLKDFKETVGERGLIIYWAPQKEVLAHDAVGSFWSHCGWNSTLESLSEGVPMICKPCFGDQKVNTRYLCHVWKVGLQLEGELERGKISRAIRRIMKDDEGKEIMQRSTEMKEIINKSIEKGGSSYNYATGLAELILSFSAQK